ncbi:MAG: NUMOD3 domain-containing DNA-binding protein [Ferrovibrio sp.]|uniref:NUMOD3 domain-containing DNA-binding protein n=1 Tax=Ferrovibrio sp. TaxID=1917215 RepID=UPI00261A686A|nr:NUMOD3 domain-containing DNA-binding protein [Ferrovibrio sp.]MCW0235268.1 NUMOD3 domain-containing DNA-binding protein [Ferrovibrio sp.]
MTFYIYTWTRPDTNEVFYVGKGSGRRDITPKLKNPLFSNVVNKLKQLGFEPIVERIHEDLSESDAFEIERREIALRGRRDLGAGPLTNLTDGGEGMGGLVHRADSRAKMSASKRGVTRSAASIAKGAASNTGQKRTQETKEKMRATQTGKTMSPKSRRKIGDAVRGRLYSEEHKLSLASIVQRRAPRSSATSPFKGVNLHRSGRWVAKITVGGRQQYLGIFDDQVEAAIAYDVAAHKAFGAGCYINIPDKPARVL